MLSQVELFCLGLAAVVDIVLLMVVLERTNRPLTAIWLKWAITGATLWYVGTVFHVLLRETTGLTAAWLDTSSMATMAAGLLLLHSGILHAGLRIRRSGAVAHPHPDYRYLLVYSPCLFVVIIAAGIVRSGSRDFLVATRSFHLPYLAWMAVANISAAWLFVQNRDALGGNGTARRFITKFSVGLLVVTVLAACYVLVGHQSVYEPELRLITSLSPMVPTLIFAWYVFRRRLLPLVFERTLAYGAILLAVFYLHRLTLSPMMGKYSQEFQFDFVVVEGLLLVALVLAYHPLRNRVREGLRYLISGDVAQVRDATRALSVEMSRRSDGNATSIADWFTQQICAALKLQSACLRIIEPIPHVSHCAAGRPGEEVRSDTGDLPGSIDPESRMADLAWSDAEPWMDISRCRDTELLTLLRELELIAVFRFRYRDIHGMLLLGTPLSGDRLTEEQLNATSMLVDQLAATLHNRLLDAARLSAERRALQQEKLSVLGLLSGSLAHELRNPLSSIRTIATLLQEDLGTAGEHGRDVQLIISEIDRLTETTGRLLDFARPPSATDPGVCPDQVIERLLHILGHLARQHNVSVEQNLQLKNVRVAATDGALNDILFNLIKNAIEAVRGAEQRQIILETFSVDAPADAMTGLPSSRSPAAPSSGTAVSRLVPSDQPPSNGPGGAVQAEDDHASRPGGFAVIRVSDTGPGVSSELLNQIFEPFVTDKTDGTGLGLYLVGQRVRELSGVIVCRNNEVGATFEVTLPVLRTDR